MQLDGALPRLAERAAVLEVLHSERFVDQAPAEVWINPPGSEVVLQDGAHIDRPTGPDLGPTPETDAHRSPRTSAIDPGGSRSTPP